MKFECGDLERALANPDLMPEARQHLQNCAACRKQYWIWNEISNAAKELHHEWDSPDLWVRIRESLEAEHRASKDVWIHGTAKTILCGLAAAAAVFFMLVLLGRPQHGLTPSLHHDVQNGTFSRQDFLTEQALQQVEKDEAAYRRSIDELTRLVQPKLQSDSLSPIAVSYREQLLMLDSAIAETRWYLTKNRFNVRLQTELASLYGTKQHTLKEILTSG